MLEPDVTKGYNEFFDEEAGETYRTWSYRFDFDESERRYSAYFYIERPEEVNVDRLGWNDPPAVPQWWRRPSRDPYLRAIHRHLCADAGHPVDVYIQRRGLRLALFYRGWFQTGGFRRRVRFDRPTHDLSERGPALG